MENVNWEKVVTSVFSFENVGDELVGTLVKREVNPVYGNEIYTIMTEAQTKVVVFSTTVLESLMRNVVNGDMIKIKFTGTQPNKKKGMGDVKMYEVFIRR